MLQVNKHQEDYVMENYFQLACKPTPATRLLYPKTQLERQNITLSKEDPWRCNLRTCDIIWQWWHPITCSVTTWQAEDNLF